MTTILGYIADDINEGLILASQLADSHCEVSLHNELPESDPVDTATIEVITLSINNKTATDFIAEASDAITWLQLAGAKQIYWKLSDKFTTATRGNIGEIATALMQILAMKQVLYCPAKIDPKQLFKQEKYAAIEQETITQGREAISVALAKYSTENISHVICTATSKEDLTSIANATNDMLLIIGGNNLATTLVDVYVNTGIIDPKQRQVAIPTMDKNALLIASSLEGKNKIQIENYIKTGDSLKLKTEEFKFSGMYAATFKYENKVNPLIYVDSPTCEVTSSTEGMSDGSATFFYHLKFARLVKYDFEQQKRRSFIIAGEYTAHAILHELDIRHMQFGAQISTGVHWIYTEYQEATIALALKPIDLGGDNFFNDALNTL